MAECVDVCRRRGWACTVVGTPQHAAPAHIAMVDPRVREQGQGLCTVFAVRQLVSKESFIRPLSLAALTRQRSRPFLTFLRR